MENSTTTQTPVALITYTEEEANDPNFRCNPGKPLKIECNTCGCGDDGKVSFCTAMLCVGWKPPVLPDILSKHLRIIM
jgi:Pacifastin inhibitor (LCMII)